MFWFAEVCEQQLMLLAKELPINATYHLGGGIIAECDVPVPGIPGTGNFHFFGGIGTGIGKIWYRKKVSEPVSEKIWYRN